MIGPTVSSGRTIDPSVISLEFSKPGKSFETRESMRENRPRHVNMFELLIRSGCHIGERDDEIGITIETYGLEKRERNQTMAGRSPDSFLEVSDKPTIPPSSVMVILLHS